MEAGSPAQRLGALLDHLGISRAHFGGRIANELLALMAARPDLVASLTLVGPNRVQTEVLRSLGDRLAIVAGSTGAPAETVRRAAAGLPEARLIWLNGYPNDAWTDTVGDHGPAILSAMAVVTDGAPEPTVLARDGEAGEIDGIRYRIHGQGPALVLLPLLLSPGQWAPILDELARDRAVVVLGGAHLGIASLLESRAATPGYLEIVAGLVRAIGLEPGDRALDLGCGTGALDRWLVREGAPGIALTACDLNPYLLEEAGALAAAEGLHGAIDFRIGDATALPFDDDSFDHAMCFTVLEEVDADAGLGELVRVTRPGGRIAVAVRAIDLVPMWDLDLAPTLLHRLQREAGSVAGAGCADRSLYRRCRAAGLRDLIASPRWLAVTDADGAMYRYYEPYALSLLEGGEREKFLAAKAAAVADNGFLLARSLHTAVGTVPAPGAKR